MSRRRQIKIFSSVFVGILLFTSVVSNINISNKSPDLANERQLKEVEEWIARDKAVEEAVGIILLDHDILTVDEYFIIRDLIRQRDRKYANETESDNESK